MQNNKYTFKVPRLQLDITAVQNTKVTVKVPPLRFKAEKFLNKGESVTITLPRGTEIYGSKRSSNTVLIDSTADVSVTSHNYKDYTGDSSVVYPITEWDREYYIFTPGKFKYQEFSVINGKVKNRVQIFPEGLIFFEGRNYVQGSQMVIDLKPFESVVLNSINNLSGTRVISEDPVGVVTGHTCIARFSRCDHVYEQLLPVSRWGSSFIVPSLAYQKKFDSVYLQASQPTKIIVNRDKTKEYVRLTKGQVKELTIRHPESMSIQADHGIQVLMFFNGVKLGWYKYYDPFLMTILPTDHFCSSYSLEAQNGFENQALIVAHTGQLGKMQFDGGKLPGNLQWKNVPGTDYSWSKMSYKQTSGRNSHTLSSSGSPFALYSVGFDQRIGYGSIGQCLQPG